MQSPLDALSVAAAVIQFIDFTRTLISKGNELHRSTDGASAEHDELGAVATNLEKLDGRLEESLTAIQREGRLSEEEQALKAVARNCRDIANELKTALGAYKASGHQTRLKSYREAFKIIWDKGKIDHLLRRLNMAREQLVVHLLVVISKNSTAELEKISSQTRQVEGAVLGAIERSGSDLKSQIGQLSNELKHASDRNKTGVMTSWQSRNKRELEQMSYDLSEAMAAHRRWSIEQLVLDSLYFPQAPDRRNQVPDAHAKTFRWIHEDPSGVTPAWTSFPNWLNSDDHQDHLYWITGKPGSGKSTLMKFLHQHPQTQRHLHSWAGSRRMLIADCFFWNAGTPMQKSQIGLLRSLLHDLLSQARELIPLVTAWRWRMYEVGPTVLDPWTDTELLAALFEFVEAGRGYSKICIFTDGLDEFEGNDAQKVELIRLFKQLASFPHVKVCVSSRPWLLFSDAFESGPKLRLEELTKDDIADYVQDKLGGSVKFSQMCDSNDGQCDKLVTELVEKAEGVFLWVYLVVRELLQGMAKEDDMSELFERLRSIPEDLESYFKQMLTTLDPFYMRKSCELLQTALAHQGYLSLLTLSLIHEENHENVVKQIIAAPSATIENIERLMARRVNVRCKGLLEVHEKSTSTLPLGTRSVEFLHRTVADFLREDDIQCFLTTHTENTFNAYRAICTALLTQMKCFDFTETSGSHVGDELQYLVLIDDMVICLLFADPLYDVAGYKSFNGYKDPLVDLAEEMFSVLSKQLAHSEQHARRYPRRGFPGFLCSERGREKLLGSAYWNFRPEIWVRWYRDETTLLAFAAYVGLRSYVQMELQRNKEQVHTKQGRPLLDYVVGQYHEDVFVAQMLLEHGASPNENSESGGNYTVWEHFLVLMRNQTGSYVKLRYNAFVNMTKLMIEHGAKERPLYDTEVKLFYATPSEVFHQVFRLEDARELDNMMKGNRESALNNGLVPKINLDDLARGNTKDSPMPSTKMRPHGKNKMARFSKMFSKNK